MKNKILTLIFTVFVLTVVFIGPINEQVKESFGSGFVYGYGGGGSYTPAIENVGSSFKNIGDTITRSLAENGGIKFKLGGESHTIKVENIYSNSVRYEISSSTFYVTVKGGETEKVDLNGNNFYDLAITLKGLSTTKAKTKFEILPDTEKIIEEGATKEQPAEKPEEETEEIPVCEEDWECTEWSECADGEQTRACTDLNNCGTTIYKPSEFTICFEEEAIPLGTTWLIIGIMAALAITIVVVLWLQRLRLRS